MIKVQSEVVVYERNGKEAQDYSDVVVVESHHIFDDRVVLVIGDTRLLVIAHDLQAAIINACNNSRR